MRSTTHVVAAIGIWLLGMLETAVGQQLDNNKLVEFYQARRYADAAEYLLSFYPDSIAEPAVLSRLGYCYLMAGDYIHAERYYRQLHMLDSLDVSVLLNLAAINVQRGQYPSAVGYYDRVVAIDTNHVGAYHALAGLMRRQGNFDLTYVNLKRANQIQPANSDIAYDFARLCMDLERYHEADTVLQEALKADPQHGTLLLGKLLVADKLKRYGEMVELGKQLVALGDESQQVLGLLAKGYFHRDDFNGCIETYNRLLALHDRMGEIDYYYLAMAHKALKHYKEALACMDNVLELAISPNTAFYYGRKADLHDLANQPSASASSYLRSFHFSVIPIHYYSLAVLYDRKLNDTRNALRYYRLYLKQNPPPEESRYVDYVQKRLEELAQKRTQ
ncbi:Tetratricopeptide repeat-containing protein [Parapedobacter luteus]|uniref:Tetratricopeptide repeat-containing protein n=1 Tax=Parapedobacter luteus TaxID=623280 RepID=A0A1T5B2A6_9SPHI|nr:CDC27 family protein [Parapedobacter luteus]SKB41100.1 Tetratricopeptide repeat-containing protein [Parapedobacter luteus]